MMGVKAFILVVILLFNFSLFSISQQKINCDYIIEATDVAITNYNASPGDTMCLMAGARPFLYFKNINGAVDMPVVIINYGGQVVIDSDRPYGLKFAHCNYIKLTGTGANDTEYGIHINSVEEGIGIHISEKSSDFEVDHLEINNTKSIGIMAKTDPDCTFTAVRDSFTMYNVSIHHNYLHDIGTEGLYIGNSFFMGHSLSACDTVVLPHIIEGVEIYNNRLEYLGWDAIQVGCALYDCNIHDNYIYKDSQEEKAYQMSGIMINSGSACHAFNNTIVDGKGTGLFNQGLGGQRFYNNLIINAGRDYDFDNQTTKQQFGIFCKHVYVSPPDSSFSFYNNTIINPKSDGIRFHQPHSANSVFVNNIIINPGAFNYYEDNGSSNNQGYDAYIHNYLDESSVDIYNNIFERNCKDQDFNDTLNFDYHLTFKSVAFNAGVDMAAFDLLNDLDGNIRPFDRYYDQGAFELPSYEDVVVVNSKQRLKLWHNPVRELLKIDIFVEESGMYHFNTIGMNGKVLTDTLINLKHGENTLDINVQDIENGVYVLRINGLSSSISVKFIKI